MKEISRKHRKYLIWQKEIINLNNPPVMGETAKTDWVRVLMYPLGMTLSYGLFYILISAFGSMTMSITYMLFPLMMMPVYVLLPIWTNHKARLDAKTEFEKNKDIYNSYLKKQIEYKNCEQNNYEKIEKLMYLNSNQNIELIRKSSSELWSMLSTHQDYMTVRFGTYTADDVIQYKLNEQFEQNNLDTRTRTNIRAATEIKGIKNMPFHINIVKTNVIGLYVNSYKNKNKDFVSAIVTNLIFNYAYDICRLIVACKKDNSDRYEWTRWLPHIWSDSGDFRFYGSDKQSVSIVFDALESIVKDRKKINKQEELLPRYIVVINDIDLFEKHSVSEHFRNTFNDYGITIIFDIDKDDLIPSLCNMTIEEDAKHKIFARCPKLFGRKRIEISVDAINVREAEHCARILSDTRLKSRNVDAQIPDKVELLDIYERNTLSNQAINTKWIESYNKNLLVSLGANKNNEPHIINIADGADGPHALIAGATGSGKSELLQTFITSLCLNYGPNKVNFVFIDFKEGGMAHVFSDIPHNAGCLTNISENVNYHGLRAIRLLRSERKRRASILKDYNQQIDYYNESNPTNLLPHLFMVIDEFAELVSECKEFRNEIISLARIGRSLGIHLIMATQSPSISVDSQIWGNLNFKACLYMLSKEESNAVIKNDAAAKITHRGRAYLMVGNNSELTEIQTAWCGAPLTTDKDIKDYSLSQLNNNGKRKSIVGKNDSKLTSSKQGEVVLSHVKSIDVKRAKMVFCEALPSNLIQDAINSVSLANSELSVDIGKYDDIIKQKLEMVTLIFTNLENKHYTYRSNNIFVLGSRGSGKTTFLRNTIHQICSKFNKSQVNIITIEHSKETLRNAKYDQIVDNVTYRTEEKKARMLYVLRQEYEKRKNVIHSTNCSDIDCYNNATKGDYMPRLLICIDEFGEIFDNPEQRLGFEKLLTYDLHNVGIHMIITDSEGSKVFNNNVINSCNVKIALQINDSLKHTVGIDYKENINKCIGRGVIQSGQNSAVELQLYNEIKTKILTTRSKDTVLPPCKINLLNDVSSIKDREIDALININKEIPIGVNVDTLAIMKMNLEHRCFLVSYIYADIKVQTKQYILYCLNKLKNSHIICVSPENENIQQYSNVTYLQEKTDDLLASCLSNLKNSDKKYDDTILILDYRGIENGNDLYNPKIWQETLMKMMNNKEIYVIMFLDFESGKRSSPFSTYFKTNNHLLALDVNSDKHTVVSDFIHNGFLQKGEGWLTQIPGNADKIRVFNMKSVLHD